MWKYKKAILNKPTLLLKCIAPEKYTNTTHFTFKQFYYHRKNLLLFLYCKLLYIFQIFLLIENKNYYKMENKKQINYRNPQCVRVFLIK